MGETRSWGLVLAHWWAELGPKAWLQGPRVPKLVEHLWVGLVPDTASCGIQGVPKQCLPDGGQGWGPAGPRAGTGLLFSWLGLKVTGLWFFWG